MLVPGRVLLRATGIAGLFAFLVLIAATSSMDVVAQELEDGVAYPLDAEKSPPGSIQFVVLYPSADRETLTVSLENLEVVKLPNNLRFMPIDEEGVRTDLIANGQVRLIDPSIATPAEREADARARNAGVGLWATTTSIANQPDAGPSHDSKSASAKDLGPSYLERAKTLWEESLKYWLGGIGGVAVIVGAARKFRARRFAHSCSVVAIGLPGAGKTSIISTWAKLDPDVRTAPTSAPKRVEKSQQIVRGRHRFDVVFDDTAGKDTAAQFRGLGRDSIMLVVLSHTPLANEAAPEGRKDLNPQFINDQLLWLQAMMPIVFEARRPCAVIIFISKFDYVSDFPIIGANPAATEAANRIEGAFARHLALISELCHSNGVPLDIILGSAATTNEGWGITKLDNCVMKIADPPSVATAVQRS